MANIWDEFDNACDLEGMRKDLEEAEKNGGTRKEVPYGTYEVAIEKIELTKSKIKDNGKGGDPMAVVWFKITAGDFKNSMIFYNQVVKNHQGIHFFNDFLKALELDCVAALGSRDHEIFRSYAQYGGLLMDVKEEVDAAKLTFALEYSASKTAGFSNYKITEVFEN